MKLELSARIIWGRLKSKDASSSAILRVAGVNGFSLAAATASPRAEWDEKLTWLLKLKNRCRCHYECTFVGTQKNGQFSQWCVENCMSNYSRIALYNTSSLIPAGWEVALVSELRTDINAFWRPQWHWLSAGQFFTLSRSSGYDALEKGFALLSLIDCN